MNVINGADEGIMKNAVKSAKSADVRTSLVNKFRRQIKNQSYEIKSGEIASRLVSELFSTTTIIKGPGK